MAPTGCLLVGSVPRGDVESAMRYCSESLPGLQRIPDGEPGERDYFIMFQAKHFPPILQSSFAKHKRFSPDPLSQTEVEQGRLEIEKLKIETGYCTAALKSYSVFRKLKEEGVIGKDVKFQVSLPTIANVPGVLIDPAFQADIESIYEGALFRSIRKIQRYIPHNELAIQIDLGMDMYYWDDVLLKPWFEDRHHVVEYITKMTWMIDRDVEMGIHYCYGDVEHKHFVEPESLAGIVELHQEVVKRASHPFSWMHCPVPTSAMEKLDSYLSPLSELKPTLEGQDTKLYLGLVHAHDLIGTRKRIQAAQKFIGKFGVATECGWGRTPGSDIDSIVVITNEVSRPEGVCLPPIGPPA